MPLRVVIADDEMLVAMQLRHLVTSLGYEVMGRASTGKEAVDLCRAERPDLALMDVKMPEMDGLEATRTLVETCPTCVVMVTGNPRFDEVAAEAGATGYVVKPARPDIASVIETARERFRCFLEIRNRAGSTQEALKTWGVVSSAMEVLVRGQGRSEADAFGELRRSAEEQQVSLRAAAEQVLARWRRGNASG
jgi:response regulator NasT